MELDKNTYRLFKVKIFMYFLKKISNFKRLNQD